MVSYKALNTIVKDIEKYVKWLNENSVAVATPLLLSNGNSESK